MSDMNDFMEYGWEDEIVNEGTDFVLLPEGDYDFTVTGFKRGRFDGSDKLLACNKAIVTITVWGAEDKIELTENFLLCNKMEWKLSQFFLSLDMKKHGEPLRMNWNAVNGKKGKCHIYIDNYKKKDGSDGQSNKIKKFYAYDETVQTIQPVNQPAQQNYYNNPPVQQNTYAQPAQQNAGDTAAPSSGWKAGAF